MRKVTDPTDYEAIFKEDKDNNKNEKLEMLNEIVKQIYSVDNIGVKTELNISQIKAFAIADLFATRYKCPILSSLVNKLEVLLVSKDRKSRKELSEVAKSMLSSTNMDSDKPSLKDRLFGV